MNMMKNSLFLFVSFITSLGVFFLSHTIETLADGKNPEKVVFIDDFSQGTTAWSARKGKWEIKDGKLIQSSAEPDCRTFIHNIDPGDDYIFEVDAKKLGGAEGFLIIFSYQGKNVWWNIGGWGNTRSEVERVAGTRNGFTVETGKVYKIKVVVKEELLQGFIDGIEQFEVEMPAERVGNRTDGELGLGTWVTQVEYDNVKIVKLPGRPPKPLTEVMREERPKDWSYEEAVSALLNLQGLFNRTKYRLPAPSFYSPPKDWKSATSWNLWLPYQRPWSKRRGADDAPLVPLRLSLCQDPKNLYVRAVWQDGISPPRYELWYDGRNIIGRSVGKAKIFTLATKAKEMPLELRCWPIGANREIRFGMNVVRSNIGLRVRATPTTYYSNKIEVTVLTSQGEVPLNVGLTLSSDEAQIPEGISIITAKVTFGKEKYSLPVVRYREPVSKVVMSAESLLKELETKYPLTAQRRKLESLKIKIRGFKPNAGGSLPIASWRQLYYEARALKADIFLSQLAGVPPIAFVKRYHFARPFGLGTLICWGVVRRFGGGIYLFDPKSPAQNVQEIFSRDDGVIFDMSPSFDREKMLFAWRSGKRSGQGTMTVLSPGGDSIRKCTYDKEDSYHIYEVNRDGTGLRQITRGPYHDVHPFYLPDGRIGFVSTRVKSYSMCQPGAASAMYVMDSDGNNIHRISFDTLADHSPYVMDDGRIMFTRWEYVDKGLFWRQGLWTINSDGTRVRLFFGNTIGDPNVLWQAKQIPGTDDVLCTFAPHHGNPVGAIGIIANRKGMENRKAARTITPEFPSIWDTQYYWAYRDPYPISNDLFLVAYGASAERYRLFLLDDKGNKELIYSDPKISCFNPVPLVPRRLPHKFPSEHYSESKEGTYLVVDVYQGLTGVERGRVKELRIMGQVPKPTNMRGARAYDHDPLIGRGTYYVKYCYGTVPVEDDGSAYFKAPAGKEIYFSALDADGKELQRMGSATQLMPGELQSCIGCHEPRNTAPPNHLPKALLKEPSEIVPPPWGAGTIDFVRLVQPVLDRYCVKCHSGADPKGGIALSGDKTRFFNMAYDTLTEKRLVHFLWLNRAPHSNFQPLTTGARVSRLTKLIEEGHGGVEMDDESKRRIYTWIEANVPYYGTYEQTRPGTEGSRDTWSVQWYKDFDKVYQSRCTECHGSRPAHLWVNLTHPEWSRVLNAPLVKDAGGLGICKQRNGKQPQFFKDKTDPDYLAMLRSIQHGSQLLAKKPRVDMPGAKPMPYHTDFGRVFGYGYGWAGP